MNEKLAEEYAFTILIRLLQTPEEDETKYRLESLYEPSLNGLFTLSGTILAWLEQCHPRLNKHLNDN